MRAPDAPPHNIELEQALLGAMLVNNEAFHYVSAFLEPRAFFEPVHQKIYSVAADLIRVGKVANPITIKIFLPSDMDVAGLTASQYLARLAAEATTIINAADYGREIFNLATRRRLIDVGEYLVEAGRATDIKQNPGNLASGVIEELAEIVTTDAEHAGGMRTIGAAMMEYVDHVAAVYQGTASDDVIKTGLRDLDERTGGLKRGSLVILAGRPGMGKTTAALVVARDAARLAHGVAF